MAELTFEEKMRIWDKIDEQAEREGEAIRKIAEYSPTNSRIKSIAYVPKRLFSNSLCYRIERLSPEEFSKRLREGGLKTL